MIEIKNVSKTYQTKEKVKNEALKNIQLTFDDRGCVFLIGKSGSGKSTLLNLIGALDQPDQGEIVFWGEKITDKKNQKNIADAIRLYEIGFVFQNFLLLDEFDVYDNVRYVLEMEGVTESETAIMTILQEVGLKGKEHRRVNQLSGGEKQRVALARALVKDPKVLLCDEPTGSLDQKTATQIFDLLKEISRKRLVIIVSHDRPSAQKYGDRIIELSDGRIITDQGLQPMRETEQLLRLKKPKFSWKMNGKFVFGHLKRQKWRFLFSSIFVAFALTFLGIITIGITVDPEIAYLKALKEGQVRELEIVHAKRNVSDEYLFFNSINTSLEDAKEVESTAPFPLTPFYTWSGEEANFLQNEFNNENFFAYYGEFEISEMLFQTIKNGDEKSLSLLGNFPQQKNEIIIHKYLADQIIENGIQNLFEEENPFEEEGTAKYRPKSYEELLENKIILRIGEKDLTIVGIIDEDLSIYNLLKQKKLSETKQVPTLYEELKFFVQKRATTILVSEELVKSDSIAVAKWLVHSQNDEELEKIARKYPYRDREYLSVSQYTPTFHSRFSYVWTSNFILTCVSTLFILFAFLLLMNFIKVSIIQSEGQIGILRALGTSKKMIWNLFNIEGFLLGLLSFALSLILCQVALGVFNQFLSQDLPIVYHFLRINLKTVSMLLLVYFLGSFFSVLSAVQAINCLSPIDAIKKK